MKTKIIPILSLLFVLFFTGNSFAQIGSPKGGDKGNPEESVSNVMLQDVQAFPNPFQDHVTLSYTLKYAVSGVRMSITDLYGNAVWKGQSMPTSIGEHQATIRTDELKEGYYYLTVQVYRSGRMENQKIKIYKKKSLGKL